MCIKKLLSITYYYYIPNSRKRTSTVRSESYFFGLGRAVGSKPVTDLLTTATYVRADK